MKLRFKEELSMSFIHSLNNFLRTDYVLGTVLDTGGKIVSEINHVICSNGTYNRVGKAEINQVVVQMSI